MRNHMAFPATMILTIFGFINAAALIFGETNTGFDGPAELPRVYVQSDLKSTPSPLGVLHPPVQTFKDLQAAVNNATCGEIIQLQAGVTFTGTLVLPVKSCDDDHWITLRTSAPDSSLPSEGKRLTPCYAGVQSLPGRPPLNCTSTTNVMAKLVGRSPVNSHGAVNHYRFIGIEFGQPLGSSAYTLISIQDNPDHIIIDRCWIHGNPTDDTQRGVMLNGSYLAVIDSTITDIHKVNADTQGMLAWTGTGPLKLVNNFVEGGSSSIGFGGAASTIVTKDIEVRQNYLFKPMSWRVGSPDFIGTVFNCKVLFESKNSSRVLIEGNILENSWGGRQGGDGGAVWLGPKNQNNACPNCEVNDITFRYNIIRHAGAGIYIFDAASDAGGLAQQAKRYSIHDNLLDDINESYAGSGTGRAILFRIAGSTRFNPPRDVSIQHNTGLEVGSRSGFLSVDTSPEAPVENLTFKDNLVLQGKYGILGCKAHYGKAVLEGCVQEPVFTGNVLVDAGDSNLVGNFLTPDISAVDLVDYHKGNGGDYRLCRGIDDPAPPCSGASAYINRASDGRDIGADINAIKRATAGTE